MIRWVALAGILFGTAIAPLNAAAHTRTLSYSTWRENGDRLEAIFRAPWIEFRRAIPELRDVSLVGVGDRVEVLETVREHVQRHVQAKRGEAPCEASAVIVRAESAAGMIAGSWSASCVGAGELSMRWDLFFDTAPSHVHVARWESHGPHPSPREKILTAQDRSWRPETGTSAKGTRSGVAGFLGLGVSHILSGYDHLLFLAGFLLLSLTIRRLIGLVTAFTVAHSFSLAAATLGWVRPTSSAVESLIGFSIAMIALDGFGRLGGRATALAATGSILVGWLLSIVAGGTTPAAAWVGMILFALTYFRLSRRHTGARPSVLAQWLVVFMFGLVHGFGFAGALVSAQLEKGQLLPALLGFNVGVEIGQLGVLTALVLLVKLITRLDFRVVRAQYACASVLLAMGLFWFWSRLVA